LYCVKYELSWGSGKKCRFGDMVQNFNYWILEVFNGAYINNIVRFNVQDAFLESEISDDGLTRAFTHMSIRCNPGVPKEVPREMMSSPLATDPHIVDLEKSFKQLYAKIKWDHKFIRCAPVTAKEQYESLRKQLTNAKSHEGRMQSALADLDKQDYPNYSKAAKDYGLSRSAVSRRYRGLTASRKEATSIYRQRLSLE
jgi:hypothetical protein